MRLAADRAPGPARVVPRENVEVRPGDVLGDEVVEEERGDDRPGESGAPRIVDVGDVRIEEAAIVAPQRQAPHGIFELGGAREQPRGELLVVAEERGKLGPPRHARGSRYGREIDDRPG